jgi:D-arabinose 5-phosphate isomerase GutQ
MSEQTAEDSTRLLDLARALVHAEMRGLAGLEAQIDERLLKVARQLLETKGKVLTAGVGTSGETARRMAHLLSVTGTPALFIHPADALHGGLGAVTADDLVIAISKGGLTAELNEFARRARKRGAFVVVLTGDHSTELGGLGSLTVSLTSPMDGEPGGMVAMGSTLLMSSWGDALAVVTMELRRYGWDQVLATHPGGAVGRRAASGLTPALPPDAAGRQDAATEGG